MLSRNDYLEGKVTHREYYAQFVTSSVRDTVRRHIGAHRIKISDDPHFNDIPLIEWDRLGWAVSRLSDPSLHERVCVLKEAAEQLRDEANSRKN